MTWANAGTGWVAGYAGTRAQTLTVLSATGSQVHANLVAVQSDGSTKYFTGTWTVEGGLITAASVTQD